MESPRHNVQRPGLPRLPPLDSPYREIGFINPFADAGAFSVDGRRATEDIALRVVAAESSPTGRRHAQSAPGVSTSVISSLAHFDAFSSPITTSPAFAHYPFSPLSLERPESLTPLSRPSQPFISFTPAPISTPSLVGSTGSRNASPGTVYLPSLLSPSSIIEGIDPSHISLPAREPLMTDDGSKCSHVDPKCPHNEALCAAYLEYCIFCQDYPPGHLVPSIGLADLRRRFHAVSVSGRLKPTPCFLLDHYRQLDMGEIASWVAMCKEMGVRRRLKAESPQRTQQYCVRLKKWIREHRVDSFFSYLCQSRFPNDWLDDALRRRGLAPLSISPTGTAHLRRSASSASLGPAGKPSDDERDMVGMLLLHGAILRTKRSHSMPSAIDSASPSIASDTYSSMPPTPLSGSFSDLTPFTPSPSLSVCTPFAGLGLATSASHPSLPLPSPSLGMKRTASMSDLDTDVEASYTESMALDQDELLPVDRHFHSALLAAGLFPLEAQLALQALALRALLPSAFCAGIGGDVGVSDVQLSSCSAASMFSFDAKRMLTWTVTRGSASARLAFELDEEGGEEVGATPVVTQDRFASRRRASRSSYGHPR